jgi:hypothetical protein
LLLPLTRELLVARLSFKTFPSAYAPIWYSYVFSIPTGRGPPGTS